MDEHVISLIVQYLNERDLASFAQCNRSTYRFCKLTDTNHKLCKSVHSTYHFVPTLLEHARLDYCLRFLDDVDTLSQNNIPLCKFALSLVLHKTCGTKTHIVIGRCLIINNIVYAHSYIDFLSESQHEFIKDEHNLLLINDNMDRLRHKVNSIISHKYTFINMRIYNKICGDYKKHLVCGLKNIYRFAKCLQQTYNF